MALPQAVGFSEDGTWITGQTSIGYGDGDDNTELTDMEGGYTTVYLRHPFTVSTGGIPARLQLRLYVDDGAIVWINGIEVARSNAPLGTPAFNDTAPSNTEASWTTFDLSDPSAYLVEGANVLAIHALNNSLSGGFFFNVGDFSIDAELLSPALRVSHVEARQNDNYLPQASPDNNPTQGFAFAGSGIFSGQTFHVQSLGIGQTNPPSFGGSGHASNVGNRWYSSNSISPGLALVDNYDASGWLNSDFLRSNSSASAPHAENNIIQNHSWIATPANGTTAELNDIIRRQDHAIDRDGFLAMIGLNNGSGTSVPPVFGSAYNVISVGRTSGGHSSGGTVAPFDGPGRVKPEIVAVDTATSFSTPQISSAATLLLANANTRGWAAPFTSYVMKAILLAGATKDEFRTASYTWSRTEARPLDSIFGAGELNVQHSYHILDAGEQEPATDTANYGWDKASLLGAASSTYTLVLAEDITELSCVITWNRIINSESWLGGGAFSATLANMSLQIHHVDDGSSTLYDSSDSAVDNIEHVNLRGLRAGTYTLTVSTDIDVEFGIAWRAETGTLPNLTMSAGVSADALDFNFTDLAIGKEYILNTSNDLLVWSPAHTFTATATTDSHTLPAGLAAVRTFYKLTWNPVN